MLDLNTLHQINTDKDAYRAHREAADRACGHELETNKPEWFLVGWYGENLIPGTEAISVREFKATVVIPNEYGVMQKPESIDTDMWFEMLDGECGSQHEFDRVVIAGVYNNDGKLIHEPSEVET